MVNILLRVFTSANISIDHSCFIEPLFIWLLSAITFVSKGYKVAIGALAAIGKESLLMCGKIGVNRM